MISGRFSQVRLHNQCQEVHRAPTQRCPSAYWFSSDIVKVLAAFDTYFMMKRPTEVALRHFDILYSTFQLRSWVTGPNEAACRDEYLAMLDYLRTYHSSNPSLTDDSADLIEFLMGLDFLQMHEHLCYLFKLGCLCLTFVSPRYPAVVMGKVDTQGLQSRIADVVLPCQSYLSEVSDSLALCCTDVNLEKFSLLSASFGNLDSQLTFLRSFCERCFRY